MANKLHHAFGVPYIVAIRNTDINVFFRYMLNLKKVGLQIMMEAERIVFVNESYRKKTINELTPPEFKDTLEAKSIVLPNGIDPFWHENKNNKTK